MTDPTTGPGLTDEQIAERVRLETAAMNATGAPTMEAEGGDQRDAAAAPIIIDEPPQPGKNALAAIPLDSGAGPIRPFMPSTSDELTRLCTIIARGGVVPKSYCFRDGTPDRAKMAVGILAGREVGYGPMMSLRSIMVVNGMASVWGAGAKALVYRSGLVTDYRKEWIDENTITRISVTSVSPEDVAHAAKLQSEGYVKLYRDGDFIVVAKGMKLPGADVMTGAWPKELACHIAISRKGVATPFAYKFGVGDARRAKLWDEPKKLYGKYPQDMLEHRAAARGYDRGFADCLMGLAITELLEDRDEEQGKGVSPAFLIDGPETPST